MSRPTTRSVDPGLPDGPTRSGTVSGAEFVAQTKNSFDRAVAQTGRVELDLQLGTSRAKMVFAGRALPDVFGFAFDHLVTSDRGHSPPNDALTVFLWDSASTGVHPPTPPWSARDFLARGEVGHAFGDRVQLSFRIDSGVLSLFVPETNTAFCWVRDPARLPPWEIAAPLRPVLAWWAENTGRQLAHGAAVGLARGAVLLGARGGAGKSTTALSCLEAGMLYLGDDYVLLEPGERCIVSSLYSTAKLVPRNLDARLPRLRALVTGRHDREQDKVTLGLHGAFPELMARSLPLLAILIPSVGSSGSLALRPVSAATALAALAPTTVFQLPDAGAPALTRLGEFVAATPRYSLELDRDLTRNVEAIRSLIENGWTA
jgi:hypothetical protein